MRRATGRAARLLPAYWIVAQPARQHRHFHLHGVSDCGDRRAVAVGHAQRQCQHDADAYQRRSGDGARLTRCRSSSVKKPRAVLAARGFFVLTGVARRNWPLQRALADRADARLLIILDADLVDQPDLGFEPVDMIFGVVENLDENLPRHEVANRLAIDDGFLTLRLRDPFELEIAFERLARALANQQLAEILQIGQTVEHEDALDQFVRVLHLLDRFVILMLAEGGEPPVFVEPCVQEILIDGRQLVLEFGIQIFDNLGVGLHDALLTDQWTLVRIGRG
ncbi:hypothetical protein PT2222_150094 [Paraburkholderia tropica]